MKSIKTFHTMEYMIPYDNKRAMKTQMVKSEKDDFRDTLIRERACEVFIRVAEWKIWLEKMSLSRPLYVDQHIDEVFPLIIFWKMFRYYKLSPYPLLQIEC